MPRVLKWIAILLGSLVVVLVIAIASIILVSANRQHHVYAIAPDQLVLSAVGDRTRGEHYAQVGCVGCHGPDLGGQQFFDDFKMGRMWSRNLTKGEGGIGKTFMLGDWVRAIRYGVAPDGHTLLFMPTDALEHLSDGDLADVIAYLDSVPPVNRVIPEPRLGPLARVLAVVTPFPLYSAEHGEANAARTRPPSSDTVAFGHYLAEVAGCHECHGTTLANGAVGPNITSGGRLAGWKEADFFHALREGKRPDGTTITDGMPWKDFRKLSDQELDALWRYLQSVAAVVPKPKKP